jgi:hypothetical protein
MLVAGRGGHEVRGPASVPRGWATTGARIARPAVVVLVLAVVGTVVPMSLTRFTDSGSSAGAFSAATLNPPTGVSATGGSSVTLSWTASTSTGATGYKVERSTSLAGSYAQIGTATPVNSTSYLDSPAAGTYWYRLSTYVGSWASATTTPVSAAVTASTSTGAKACAPASNSADTGGNGDGYESTPTNACASDGSLATDASTGSTGHSTTCANVANDRHRFWGYAFGLPGSVSSVDGITVRADMGMNNNGGTSAVCVELSWDGGTTWTSPKSFALGATAITTYTLGSTSDTWGNAWTAAQLGAASFRVRLTDATSQANKTYRLDYLAVTVQYTP